MEGDTINELINKFEAVKLDTTDSPQMEKPSTSKNLDHSGTVAETKSQHFRTQLGSELQKIREMCKAWEKISTQTVLSRDKQELALASLGQVRLMMTQKQQQFTVLLRGIEQSQPGKVPAHLWNALFRYDNQPQNFDHGLGASTSNEAELQDVAVNKAINPITKNKTKEEKVNKKKLRRQNAFDKN